jgi:penicillin-binding protein 1B
VPHHPKHIVLRVLKRILQGFLIIVVGYSLALLGIVVWTFEVKLNRWPIFLYSAPVSINVGDEITKVKLFGHLRRLGYSSSGDAVPDPGQWYRSGSEISIFLKHCPLRGEDIVSGPITLSIDWNRVRSIRLMRSLEEVSRVTLEPELFHIIPAPGFDQELCRPVPLGKVPPLLVDAVVLTEDEHFFSHSGIDVRSIFRALTTNLKAGRYVQGGSTIPQQLIRMTVLNPDKTLMRKFNEVFLALVADTLYSKRTILEAYLNRVYLGHRGTFPIKGIAEAVRHLFGKDLSELDAAECALIAATIRAPNVITSHRHPERARERRNMVLGRLFKAGKISRETYDDAMNSPVRMTKTNPSLVRAPAFVDLVKDDLPSGLPGTEVETLRQDVLTSLDPLLQNEADAAMKPLIAAGLQTYGICADPKSGEIKALLTPSGIDRWSGKGGDTTSLLPFLVIPSLAPEDKDTVKYTLTSQFVAEGQSTGTLTLRRAFLETRQAFTAQIVAMTGPERIIGILKEFGINGRSAAGQGVNTDLLTPMEMAQRYAILAALGKVVPLRPGLRIVNAATPDQPQEVKRISVQPAVLFLVNHLLKGLAPATGKDTDAEKSSLPSLFTAADKAGLWSIAYTEDALFLLRISEPRYDEVKIEALVKRLLPERARGKEGPAAVPEGIVFRNTCLDSGLRATSLCPRVMKEPFLKGSQPAEWCPLRHESVSERSAKRK